MFLKRGASKLRLLKKKHFIDLWGQYKKKKKFRQRHFQRTLLLFSKTVDRTLYTPVKFVKEFSYLRSWIHRGRKRFFRRYRRRRPVTTNRRSLRYRKPTIFRKIQEHLKEMRQYRRFERSKVAMSFFKIYLRGYYAFRHRLQGVAFPRFKLKHANFKSLSRWRSSWARKIARVNTKRYRIKPEEFRRVYLRTRRSRRIEFVRQQYYFGFRSTKVFLLFFRKFEIGAGASRFNLGLEGLLPHLLFRCNLVSTVRGAHILIRLRGVHLNGRILQSPHKCLRVGDRFGVLPRYIRYIFRGFRKTLRRRLLKVNIPNYLEYNYRLMLFFIWRRPTATERTFLHHTPFKRTLPAKAVGAA